MRIIALLALAALAPVVGATGDLETILRIELSSGTHADTISFTLDVDRVVRQIRLSCGDADGILRVVGPLGPLTEINGRCAGTSGEAGASSHLVAGDYVGIYAFSVGGLAMMEFSGERIG